MAGRIRDEDVLAVRERARIDDVVREYVSLKPAGGGSLKGLCPFHDERSPSFHVTPVKGFYHCFGCQEGGDVITFVQKVDHLTFTEAVEKLAGRYNVQLRYEDAGTAPTRSQGQRTRLVEANRAAAAFYGSQLATAEAETGRRFLLERGFAASDAEHFGVGYAPKGWGALVDHLRSKGFNDQELLTAGLVAQGNRGVYDRFRGRLVWPIREVTGETVGF
ncbi:MAG TPA: CHC2 zinc finger domain-containing protein, partial [Solirubrobacterales bacterium]